ncbi:hypothetical protein MAR_005276 [Mya arenaria]|uniref:Uncharacterized protein n=1 Tax=Mya arenaria TaxID=6604 RepID=A0ABY7F2X2_MYAAR|nr:hypothetical protein MAR_005276 [Mya arenaria]
MKTTAVILAVMVFAAVLIQDIDVHFIAIKDTSNSYSNPGADVAVANGATRNSSIPWADVANGAVLCAVGAGGVDMEADTEADTEADMVAAMEAAWAGEDTEVDMGDMGADTEVDMEVVGVDTDGERGAVMEVTVEVTVMVAVMVVMAVAMDGARNIEPSRHKWFVNETQASCKS